MFFGLIPNFAWRTARGPGMVNYVLIYPGGGCVEVDETMSIGEVPGM
jgi:hypothetical protein